MQPVEDLLAEAARGAFALGDLSTELEESIATAGSQAAAWQGMVERLRRIDAMIAARLAAPEAGDDVELLASTRFRMHSLTVWAAGISGVELAVPAELPDDPARRRAIERTRARFLTTQPALEDLLPGDTGE